MAFCSAGADTTSSCPRRVTVAAPCATTTPICNSASRAIRGSSGLWAVEGRPPGEAIGRAPSGCEWPSDPSVASAPMVDLSRAAHVVDIAHEVVDHAARHLAELDDIDGHQVVAYDL